MSAFATSYVAFLGDTTATIAVTVSALVGVALYASAFVWLGLVTTQAIGIGLLYIVLWEGFFSGFVSGVRLLSIRHYAIALMHGLDARRFARARPPEPRRRDRGRGAGVRRIPAAVDPAAAADGRAVGSFARVSASRAFLHM